MRADTRPAAYLVDILPETFLDANDLLSDFSGSVLDFLLARGDKFNLSRATISATNATAEVAKALEIQRGDVLLYFVSQLYDANNLVVDYSVSYFIPGYFRFHVNRRVGNG
jgi:GntR family transcriptional regulator